MTTPMDLLVQKVERLEEELLVKQRDIDTMRHNFKVDTDDMRKALIPFAKYASSGIAPDELDDQRLIGYGLSAQSITVGDFRNAAQAIGYELEEATEAQS